MSLTEGCLILTSTTQLNSFISSGNRLDRSGLQLQSAVRQHRQSLRYILETHRKQPWGQRRQEESTSFGNSRIPEISQRASYQTVRTFTSPISCCNWRDLIDRKGSFESMTLKDILSHPEEFEIFRKRVDEEECQPVSSAPRSLSNPKPRAMGLAEMNMIVMSPTTNQ